MQEVVTFPTLYGKTSTGKTKVWYARVMSNPDGHGISEIKHGQLDEKLQTAEKIVDVGKNIGKKNETTPVQQCIYEVKRKWTDKKEKEGYTEDDPESYLSHVTNASSISDISTMSFSVIYPMLAHKYDAKKPKKNDIVFPCFVQPKLDGLRCLVYANEKGDIVTQSRTGGMFEHMGHILREVTPLLNKYPRLVLDGELYTTEIPFETLAGLIKKKHLVGDDLKNIQQIEYHVYDLIHLDEPNMPFLDRILLLNTALKTTQTEKKKYKSVRRVQTYPVNTHAEFYEKFQEFIADGYEGAMLRNTSGPYKQNTRSNNLQKYKEFQEEEYPIIGFAQGEGRDAGSVIWTCKTPDGTEFNVRPRGTMAYRRDLYKNGKKYIGSLLTVIFQELSVAGVPRFPVGKCIRDGF